MNKMSGKKNQIENPMEIDLRREKTRYIECGRKYLLDTIRFPKNRIFQLVGDLSQLFPYFDVNIKQRGYLF